jgi:hypothetical protein
MGTLKSTIKIESTDLFPTPVSFTVVNNNAVNGTFSGFNNLVASPSAVTLNIAPINTGVAYVYAQAPTTNGTAVYISESGGSVFAVLAPGDVAFFPYGQNSLGGNDLQAATPGGGATAQINYFVGEKA